VVALVEDGGALVSTAAQLWPDVIVADISMPILDGIDAQRDPSKRPRGSDRPRDGAFRINPG
jgi:CheY-like chemotaxis protein